MPETANSPLLEVRIVFTRIESLAFNILTEAIAKGFFSVVSFTVPLRVVSCAKEEIVNKNAKIVKEKRFFSLKNKYMQFVWFLRDNNCQIPHESIV